MNTQAQTGSLMFSIVVGLMIFFVGMIVFNFIKTSVTDARTDNSCTAPLTDGGKALCLVFDIVVPYFMVIVLSIVGGLVIFKFIS